MPSPPPPPPSLPSSPPYTAKPIPASTLLDNFLRQQQGHRQYHNSSRGLGEDGRNEESNWDRVTTGFVELDEYVLMGGVERGTVVGVSGDMDGGSGGEGGVGRLISLHLLATVLLCNPMAKASIIDTTGSFQVSLLARIIRLRSEFLNRQDAHKMNSDIDLTLNQRVQEILGRVAISRVFDIEGIWEVLSEISTDCQSHAVGRDVSNLAEDGVESVPDQMNEASQTARTKSLAVEVAAERDMGLEICDSEAEEDEEDLEEVNIFHKDNIDLPQDNVTTDSISTFLAGKLPENRGRTEIVVIDNMTTPINELFSHRERTSAHNFLSTFSRTIRTLSQTQNILTVLINALTTPSSAVQGQNQDRRPSSRPSIPKNSTSVFASTTSRPALGRLFSEICALHLLITSVPKTAQDAQVLYASPSDPADTAADDDDDRQQNTRPQLLQQTKAPNSKPAIAFALVIEVLKDTTPYPAIYSSAPEPRAAAPPPLGAAAACDTTPPKRSPHVYRRRDRTQRWAPFVVAADGLTLENAFGAPTAAARRSAVPQMHIMKQFPLGRRT